MVADLVKRILPKAWVHFIQCCRYRGIRRHISYAYRLRALRKQFLRSKRSTSETEFVLASGVKFNIDPKARHAFEHFTHLEPDMVKEMTIFLDLTGEKRCLLDVGALYGIFSLSFASRPGAEAFAFEPNPDSFAILSNHVRLNQGLHIRAENIAVGETERTLRMHTGFHLMAVPEGHPSTGDFTTVQATSLDSFVARNKLMPDVIKVDVEGYEGSVLAGAKEVLQEKRPLLFLEIHPGAMLEHGTTPLAIYDQLSKLGYQFFDNDLTPVGTHFFERPDIFRIVASCNPLSRARRDRTGHAAPGQKTR